MTGLLLRRLRDLIFILLIVGTMMFFIIRLMPGDPALSILGPTAKPWQLAELRHSMGLTGPLYQQYFHWLGGIAQGHLGNSLTFSAPVLNVVLGHVLPTLTLAVISTVLAFGLSILINLWNAVRPGSWLARAVNRLTSLGMALPDFWIGIVLALVFAVHLRFFPASGYVSIFSDPVNAVEHLVLPVVVLVIGQTALYVITLREGMLSEMTQAYLRTARMKGLSETKVMFRHVLRNALLPSLTVLGTNFAFLVSGIVIIESIFVIPGLGTVTMSAISTRDFPLVQGVALFIALVFVLVNLIIDLVYALIDPKVRVS